MRLPVGTSQERSGGALDLRDAQNGLRVAGSVAVPESPQILERRIALPIKKRMLQAVGLVARKAVGDVHRCGATPATCSC